MSRNNSVSDPLDFPAWKSAYHVCDLTDNKEEIIIPRPAPYASCFRKFLHGLYLSTTLHRRHPDTKRFFRSKASIKREERRQALNPKYHCIIHPFSKFSFFSETITIGFWVTALTMEPYTRAFHVHFLNIENEKTRQNEFIDHMALGVNLLLFVDIILNFSKGYAIEDTKEVVLDRGRIVRRYFKTFFLFDFISVGQFMALYFIHETNLFLSIAALQLYCCRYVRIYSMLKYFCRILIHFKIKETSVQCILGLIFSLYLLHWLTCHFFAIPLSVGFYSRIDLNDSWVVQQIVDFKFSEKNSDLYVKCFVAIICHFFGASKGFMATNNPIEQFYLSFVSTAGIACQMYAIAHVLYYFGTIQVSECKYEELLYQLNDYVITKKLPTELRKRLFLYYETRFQKHFFSEESIMSALSEHLRYEVVLFSGKSLIANVKIFQGASKSVVGTILAMMKSEIFLADDVLVKPEMEDVFIYFISFGTVAGYLLDGREVYHLEDGHHLGEVQIVLQYSGAKTMVIMKAVEATEVYYLNKQDFLYVLDQFPELIPKLHNTATAKMNMIYSKVKAESETIDTTDIITELKRGNILDHGRKRV